MRKITVLAGFFVIVVFFYQCMEPGKQSQSKAATYSGTSTCKTCHTQQYADYITSDHYHAMDTASSASVKANFNNSFFVYHGDTSFFYINNGRYYVKTKDSTGIVKDFLISYTFGWYPLQQYLIKFSDGRIQTLPFCWDTRPKENGGQRWFHLYSNDKVLPGDELFWMEINQNWNYMCADCHTTDYKTNFNATANTFNSTWKEATVSCESCHGPASQHLQWAVDKNTADTLKGFAISLKPLSFNWVYDTARGIRMPVNPVHQTTQIETCARCHSRATRLSDEYVHGQSLLQTHLPALPDTSIYYPDGQIKDEDYEYGSFLQSKMYASGITCTDCHQQHSMKLKMAGNAVCASCHSPAKFDVPEHTHHKINSTGSSCKSCHMPTSIYMGIDERFDHSLRNPRPDLSLQTGSPNACNKCHTDKTVQWATASFTKWYGSKIQAQKSFGLQMTALLKTNAGSKTAFAEMLMADNYPAIVKGTAMQQYTQYAPADIQEVNKYLQNSDPLLRLTALRALAYYPAEIALPAASPLLKDKVRSVRLEAVSILANNYYQMDQSAKAEFLLSLKEYMIVQQNMSHRPEGILNQASMKLITGETNEALQLYLTGMQRFPRYIPMYINLADFYRASGEEENAKGIIDKALTISPGHPQLHYILGLWQVRNKNQQAGLTSLKKAMELDKKNPSLVYAYSIGIFSEGKKEMSVSLMENYLEKNGNSDQIINGLISVLQDMNQPGKAAKYIQLRKEVFGY